MLVPAGQVSRLAVRRHRSSPTPTPPGGLRPCSLPMQWQSSEPEIQIEFHPEGLPAFAALVRLSGEHDLATGAELRSALRLIDGNVLVDLSECSFIDSTTIGVVVADHQARSREGQRLELLVPPENTLVKRTLEVSGVAKLVPLRTSLS